MNNPLASLSLAWMLSGCTSPYPIPVEQPRPAPWPVSAEKYPKIDNIKKIALVYRNLWREKYISLYQQTYGYNEVGFLGTLVAVISAASGSVTTAMYSGGIAVGDNIFLVIIIMRRKSIIIRRLRHRLITCMKLSTF
ncbi:hypothetical protein AB3Y61_004162 [Serratia marcescens]